ncbi:pantoate--beta-alanine ligase [Clostridium bowmanii]|uniref:pantoate--beta-alanine ligase n=1 Tax=Clostridium bowmanii TaxID=132925 RepID=UPI001C0E6ECF|nr:pantoate--beta-alanine ligase [Clostridium bowmanii]MBU3190670.1 pantoate--beta-alanine ligase [Clostridium bowmanii]MCA1072566.1 pantoate--beta-alanine ligase [Clostridium bowmanii]
MNIAKTIEEVRSQVNSWKKEGYSIALVPTMGYLHEGHVSLIKRAANENQKVVVSIFVNPIQFGPSEDLASYPRDLDRDKILCEGAGANLIFAPEASEMYYVDAQTNVSVNGLTNGLCGAKRPGHFNGVCTVVSKLFNIVCADKAYFGEKDAQQLAVIKRMVRDLNFPIEIIGCPIVREADGLAKSSRNNYLSTDERTAALILNKSLNSAKELLLTHEKSAENLTETIKKQIQSEVLAKIDYIEVVDALSLTAIDLIDKPVLVAIAVYIGKTRLIDNFIWQSK